MNPRNDRSETLPNEEPVWRAIGASWMAMKRWVKVWLFALNGVFLSALFFWPRQEVQWILIAYVSSGPLLVGMMVWQRGLTRLLGLAHLLPWIPLVGYLLCRLTTNVLGPPIRPRTAPVWFGYLILLLGSLTICLIMDVADVVRWYRGERYVLGSSEAASVGASYRATIAEDAASVEEAT